MMGTIEGRLSVSFVRMEFLTKSEYAIIKSSLIWPRGYKTFFMLNSTEHEMSTAFKKYRLFLFLSNSQML